MSYIFGVLPSSLLLQRKQRCCHLNPLVWVSKCVPSKDKGRKKTQPKPIKIPVFIRFPGIQAGKEPARWEASGCRPRRCVHGCWSRSRLQGEKQLVPFCPNLSPNFSQKKGWRGKKPTVKTRAGLILHGPAQHKAPRHPAPGWGGSTKRTDRFIPTACFCSNFGLITWSSSVRTAPLAQLSLL